VAGIDSDPACEYPFSYNNRTRFIRSDVRKLDLEELAGMFPRGAIRLVAGCAPCQPFSSFRRGGSDNSSDTKWGLLAEFGRIVETVLPDLVTMENVPDLA